MVAMADPVPNLTIDFTGGASGGSVDGDLASRIMADSQRFGTLDLGAVNAALSSLDGGDGAVAGSVLSEVNARLTPVEQGQLAAEADIVVTAERRPVSDAEIAAYDRANQERPTEAVAFANTRQLDVAEGYFHAQQALTGSKANDAEIQSRFDTYRADLEGRERVANAVADRAVLDVVKAALPPLDTGAALYRVGVNGEYTLENGLTIGGAALGGVLGAVGKAGTAAVEGAAVSGETRALTALQSYWPPNRGFDGAPIAEELATGTRIDRYGYEGGTFLSPEGTPDWMRSLAPGTTSKPYNVYEVANPIEVQSGKAAPWFNQVGGGTQYELPMSVSEAIREGHLRRVGP